MRIMEEGLHNGTRADPTVGESGKGRVQRRSWRVQGESLASPPAARREQLPEQGHEGELGEQPTEECVSTSGGRPGMAVAQQGLQSSGEQGQNGPFWHLLSFIASNHDGQRGVAAASLPPSQCCANFSSDHL